MTNRRRKRKKRELSLDKRGGTGNQEDGNIDITKRKAVGGQDKPEPTLLKKIITVIGIASGIATILAFVFSLNPPAAPGSQLPNNSDTLLVTGIVVDQATGRGIPNAWFTSNKNWKDTIRTTSDGTFEWQLRAEAGESVRVYAQAAGYSPRDEYKMLWGPMEIYLERDKKTSK